MYVAITDIRDKVNDERTDKKRKNNYDRQHMNGCNRCDSFLRDKDPRERLGQEAIWYN